MTGAAIGAFNGFFPVKFRLPSFIVTICAMYLFRGLCAFFTTDAPVPASQPIKAMDDNALKIAVTVGVLLIAFLVFPYAGALTGVAAFVNVTKVGSITSTAGNQLETQIWIALALGGMPVSGGAKARFSTIIVGTPIYTVPNNGLVMVGLDTASQQLVQGPIFLARVTLPIDRKALKVI